MKLEWQSNPSEKLITWHNAVDYVKSLGDGWRLPTRDELINAYDSSVKGFMSYYYWSSSTYAQGNNNAWVVHFYNGNVLNSGKTYYYYVRCVRDIKENKK